MPIHRHPTSTAFISQKYFIRSRSGLEGQLLASPSMPDQAKSKIEKAIQPQSLAGRKITPAEPEHEKQRERAAGVAAPTRNRREQREHEDCQSGSPLPQNNPRLRLHPMAEVACFLAVARVLT
jgi:hypothetical protein